MIEKLGEVGAQPCEQATRNHHLLLKEKRGVQMKVQLLYFPKELILVDQQAHCCHYQCYYTNERGEKL